MQICEHMEDICEYLCTIAATAVTSAGEMHYGMHSCPTFRQLLSDADLISSGAKLVYLLVCGLGVGTWVESDDVSQVQECKNQGVNILGPFHQHYRL